MSYNFESYDNSSIELDYYNALYRRNNNNVPCVYYATIGDDNNIHVFNGILGYTISHKCIRSKNPIKELETIINNKRKQGYVHLNEIKDDSIIPPVGKEADPRHIANYCNTYLPFVRSNAGVLLPMLAKTYDINKSVFNKESVMLGQFKINGLRCFIKVEEDLDNMFNTFKFRFFSREGIEWKSLNNLSDKLLAIIPRDFISYLYNNNVMLDGELYIPNKSVNEINSAVKNVNNPDNNNLQYWCYDLAIDGLSQEYRFDKLQEYNMFKIAGGLDNHLNNTNVFVVLPYYTLLNDEEVLERRDDFIRWGYEGIILRRPNDDYQFGKRCKTMYKFKKHTDGIFTIVDIKPEGIKRPDIPIIVCKNDLNDCLFETRVGGVLDYQRSILANKDLYIGKQLIVEFGERSGVNNLPFHIKGTYIKT